MFEEKEKKTDEELKQIAVDLLHGQIYSTQHQFLIDNPDMIPSVFLPLALMTPEVSKDFLARKPAMIFEYINKAGQEVLMVSPVSLRCNTSAKKNLKKSWNTTANSRWLRLRH